MEILEEFLYLQGTIEAYTILMDFQIGTWVEEVVVLTREDTLDNEVYIHRSEIVNMEKENGKYVRKEYKIVEYLFMRENGKRMTSRSFNYWLAKYCRDAGISFMSSHCIRRTFASRLFAAGMPLAEISIYMGHENIETTKGYIYNYHEIELNRSYMNKAL